MDFDKFKNILISTAWSKKKMSEKSGVFIAVETPLKMNIFDINLSNINPNLNINNINETLDQLYISMKNIAIQEYSSIIAIAIPVIAYNFDKNPTMQTLIQKQIIDINSLQGTNEGYAFFISNINKSIMAVYDMSGKLPVEIATTPQPNILFSTLYN